MKGDSGIGICQAPFESAEIAEIVRIHRAELGGGFLSSLGDRVLGLLFEHAAECPTAILLSARPANSRKICGFLLGTFDTRAFYRSFLKRRALRAGFLVLPKILSFRRVLKVIETVVYPSRRSVQKLPPAELLDVAVAKSIQGAGVGRKLFAVFCEKMREHSVSEFRITTGEDLIRAHRFYEHLGAHRVKDIEVHSGAKTFVFLYRLDAVASRNTGRDSECS